MKDFDYAQPGAYYVTIVTQSRELLLGSIEREAVELSDAGRMVEYWWKELRHHFASVDIDAFVVMPNHLHGILMLAELPGGHAGPPLPRIIAWFKTMTTNAYIRGVNEHGWQPFSRRFWQRGYYERIIRDEKELASVRDYIAGNPQRWEEDLGNPRPWGGRQWPQPSP